MKTHSLKAFKSVEYFYQIRQLNEEQLSGEKLSAHLTNITMAFWYDLTSPIAANPDSYDIHSHGIDGPYRSLKMTPGADVIDALYDRIQDKAADLEKALNKAFNTKAFDLKVRREGGELDLLVAFVSAEGGIFQCNSTVEGGSYGVALRIPNDEEMKVTFDSMAQVPAPSNVDDEPEMDVEPEADLDDIPELDPEAEVEVEEEVDLLEPKGKKIVRPEFDDFAQDEIEDEPFEPADDAEVDGGDIEDSPGTYTKLAEEGPPFKDKFIRRFNKSMTMQPHKDGGDIDWESSPKGIMRRVAKMDNSQLLSTYKNIASYLGEPDMSKFGDGSAASLQLKAIAREMRRRGVSQETLEKLAEEDDMDLAEKLGEIEGALKALVLKVEDPRIVDEIERLIKIAEAKPVDLDFKGFTEATNLVLRMMAPKSMNEGFGKVKDAQKTADRWEKQMTVKLSKDGETKTFLKGASGIEKHKADGWVEVKEEDLEEDAPATSVGSVAAAAGDTGVPGHDAGPCACCGKKPCKCGPNCPTCGGVKVEQTEYRYVSLTRMNPFQR